MKSLKKIDFSTNMFTTEQIAWLRARTGNSLRSENLHGYRYEDNNCIIVGKRKPILTIEKDKNKINKYIKKFESLVQYYHENKNVKEPI
jgi:hypothetical protein